MVLHLYSKIHGRPISWCWSMFHCSPVRINRHVLWRHHDQCFHTKLPVNLANVLQSEMEIRTKNYQHYFGVKYKQNGPLWFQIELTTSKHLFEHCFVPMGEHGYMLSCSCIKTGWPFGGSLEPRLNCPEKKTPHVQYVWFTWFNLSGSIGTGNSDFNPFHSNPFDVVSINPIPNRQQKNSNTTGNFMIQAIQLFEVTTKDD